MPQEDGSLLSEDGAMLRLRSWEGSTPAGADPNVSN